jgi:hypothetical protein
MMVKSAADARHTWLRGVATTAIWILFYFCAQYALSRFDLEPHLRTVLALVPVVPAAFFLWFLIERIRTFDELQLRIHLDALVLACPLAVLLLITLGLLEPAIPSRTEDWSYRYVWVFPPLFNFIGVSITSRRYQ